MKLDYQGKCVIVTGAGAGIGLAVYGSAKAAVNALMRSHRADWGARKKLPRPPPGWLRNMQALSTARWCPWMARYTRCSQPRNNR